MVIRSGLSSLAVLLVAEPGAEAAEAHQHLVDDPEDAEAVLHLVDLRQVLVRRHDGAGAAGRLGDDRRHLVHALVEDHPLGGQHARQLVAAPTCTPGSVWPMEQR